ncbi:MAG: Gldg family protein [Planctomycetota bacterium]|nr:Gldg family protein [Planctomycetota bacterium]
MNELMHAPRYAFLRYVVSRVVMPTLLVLGSLIFGYFLIERSSLRWDLTEDQRYTVSDGTRRLVASLKDKLTIRAYFSVDLPPQVRPLERYIFDILEEFVVPSGGKIALERKDPAEKKTVEDEAQAYGVRPAVVGIHEATSSKRIQIWGALVLNYQDRAPVVIDLATRYARGYEGFAGLEYELHSAIWELVHDKPQVGITGYLTRSAPRNFMAPPQPGGGQPFYQGFRRLLGDSVSVTEIDLKTTMPDVKKMPLLLVVRPKEFTDVEIFRLDQYLMKGGRVIVFVSLGELDENPMMRTLAYRPFRSGLEDWLGHHGVRIAPEFVCHFRDAWEVQIEQRESVLGPVGIMAPNWFWPRVYRGEDEDSSINTSNPATSSLRTAQFFWPHPVELLPDRLKDSTGTVLVRSDAPQSWRRKDTSQIDFAALVKRPDQYPTAQQLGRSSPLAVALEGKFSTYFDERHPVPPSLLEADAGAEKGEEKKGPEIVRASSPTQLVVVSDANFISDFLLGGQNPEAQKQYAMLAFNLVDWLARSEDLIRLRNKQYQDRRLVDPEFKAILEEANEELSQQEITVQEFRERVESGLSDAKQRWKQWRWRNVLGPPLLIVFLGFLIWILRAALRSRSSRLPEPQPPSS